MANCLGDTTLATREDGFTLVYQLSWLPANLRSKVEVKAGKLAKDLAKSLKTKVVTDEKAKPPFGSVRTIKEGGVWIVEVVDWMSTSCLIKDFKVAEALAKKDAKKAGAHYLGAEKLVDLDFTTVVVEAGEEPES